ncbi:hypothetical protein [Erythrobacter donghaensis]|jgi:hypothetical protein|nr:hypothetical protein [Erythrobacter donghaensis]
MLDLESRMAAIPGCWKIPAFQQPTPFETIYQVVAPSKKGVR